MAEERPWGGAPILTVILIRLQSRCKVHGVHTVSLFDSLVLDLTPFLLVSFHLHVLSDLIGCMFIYSFVYDTEAKSSAVVPRHLFIYYRIWK